MPQLRKNPITHQWSVIATERSKRPENFTPEVEEKGTGPDPFAEGLEANTTPETMALRKPGSHPNTPGWRIRVIANMFPIVGAPGKLKRNTLGIFEYADGVGSHELVITRDPARDEAAMSVKELDELLWVFQERYKVMKSRREIEYIQIFKNHGSKGGASLRHPHHQIVGIPFVANDIQREVEGFKSFHKTHKKHALVAIIAQEKKEKTRIVFENDRAIVFCPYFSENPFEMWVALKKQAPHFENASDADRRDVADALQAALGKLHNTLKSPSLNYVLHTAPCDEKPHPTYHWFIRLFPRLITRAGFELGTGIMVNVVAPEDAAKHLRKASRKVK